MTIPHHNGVAVPDVFQQHGQAWAVISRTGHVVGERLRHSGLGERVVLLIKGLGYGRDAGIADPLTKRVAIDGGMTHEYQNRRFENLYSETNFRDSSTSANGARSGRAPGVSNVVYFKTAIAFGDRHDHKRTFGRSLPNSPLRIETVRRRIASPFVSLLGRQVLRKRYGLVSGEVPLRVQESVFNVL